tara:strand:- start:457 stop:1191 length:735 start_codon:yes stop_codon:yes gene_type:complete
MGSAKRIRVEPISAADAKKIITRFHYSGGVKPNSQLHLGVFMDGKCGGAMSFGPSIDKRKMLGLVRGTGWNNFIELNRMAFADWLPRNSESRALGYAMKMMRRVYPHIKWVISFSDATQCGDGTIYRASGFLLTQINKNTTMIRLPDGTIVANKTLDNGAVYMSKIWKERGARPLEGYQLRYIRFLDPAWVDRLTVPTIPFSKIKEVGASMIRGVRSDTSDTSGSQPEEGGATPTRTLSPDEPI